MRRILRPVLLAVVVLALAAQAALAARPIHEKFVIDETFTRQLCGITVAEHHEVKVNRLHFEDRLLDLDLLRFTWTNADGDWLEFFAAGPAIVTEELDGDILTLSVEQIGIQQRLRSSDGVTAAFDRGQITLRIVVDLNDLEDPTDDVLISFEFLDPVGPHPAADSNGALFCEVVHDVLG